MEMTDRPGPPTGLARVLWRLPILLYRCGLGRLLGHRVMLLTHIGRSSGQPRHAVLEVVEHDRSGYIAASGFGARADWYRNVIAEPDVTIQIAARKLNVTAAPLSAKQGGEVMARYAGERPAAARRLCGLMGFRVDGGVEDYREVGEQVPFVRFTIRGEG
ncbi:nitroreductase family deazaflavin-dependent oxidoreductase [Actinoplanes sp. NPDC051343]|uniref:nitroreductase family deazaflavin-dependent oxidoreductase n=1 Tax=Actinoplanes sp. NPDC051343 TaxID=3363906 RepID=UPI00378A739E